MDFYIFFAIYFNEEISFTIHPWYKNQSLKSCAGYFISSLTSKCFAEYLKNKWNVDKSKFLSKKMQQR